MRSFLEKIFLKSYLNERKKRSGKFTLGTFEKEYQRFLTLIKLRLKDSFLIFIGVISAGFGLKGFLLPNGFIDGGAVGISLLIASKTQLSISVLLVIVNIPFVLLAFKVVSMRFALVSALSIVFLSIAISVIPYPEVTHDKLLIAFFGGFFLGLGIGMAVRGGGVLDGTEVLAIHLSRTTSLTIGDIILIINIIIFLIAAYLLNVEVALYSILTYIVAVKTLDYVLNGVEEYIGVTIISSQFTEVRDMITKKLGRGVTVYNGESGWVPEGQNPKNLKIIFTVITRLEISKLNTEIALLDPDAFVITNSIKDTKGGMIKRRAIH